MDDPARVALHDAGIELTWRSSLSSSRLDTWPRTWPRTWQRREARKAEKMELQVLDDTGTVSKGVGFDT
jgi:hypothetical protein